MEQLLSSPAWDFGVAGVALIVVYKSLELLKLWWLCRNGDGKAVAGEICSNDPGYFERLKRIEQYTEASYVHAKENREAMVKVREGVMSGKFGCTWKDRDEVLESIHAMKELTEAVNCLTIEIRKQNGN